MAKTWKSSHFKEGFFRNCAFSPKILLSIFTLFTIIYDFMKIFVKNLINFQKM